MSDYLDYIKDVWTYSTDLKVHLIFIIGYVLCISFMIYDHMNRGVRPVEVAILGSLLASHLCFFLPYGTLDQPNSIRETTEYVCHIDNSSEECQFFTKKYNRILLKQHQYS